MSSFDNLESLYQHLEDHAGDYKYPHQISDLFQEVRDAAKQKDDISTKQRAQWEIDAFYVILKDGGAKAFFTQADAKGDVVQWPDISQFNEEAWAYLNGRVMATANPILRARYAHILWNSPKKHQKYACMAVTGYLDLVQLYEGWDRLEPNEHFGLNVLDSVKNAYLISHQVKWKTNEVSAEIERLVSDFNRTSRSAFALRVNLIKLILQDPKSFSQSALDRLADNCWRTSQDLSASDNLHNAIKMLELGQKADARVGKRSHAWCRRSGELYEQLMNQREAGDLAAPEFCRLAIESYRRAGDDLTVTQLEKKHQSLKQAMKFEGLGGEVDLSEIVRKGAEVADRLVQRSADDTIHWLMTSRILLPDYKDVEDGAEAAMGKYIFLQIMPVTVLDHAGHPAQHFVEPDERKYHAMLQDYRVYVETVTRLYLRQVLVRTIGSGVLSANSLIEFLGRSSWMGRDLTRELPNDVVIVYNWLALVAPALLEYFCQVTNWTRGSQYQPNFVVTVDSLVLKIEGLLRDLCRFSGGITSRTVRDPKDRSVEREKDIHMLLHDPQVMELIGLDDLLFLRFLLVEKAGYNLRHRVAHALMCSEEYLFEYANLLVLALLRLAKYDFRQSEDMSVADGSAGTS